MFFLLFFLLLLLLPLASALALILALILILVYVLVLDLPAVLLVVVVRLALVGIAWKFDQIAVLPWSGQVCCGHAADRWVFLQDGGGRVHPGRG